MSSYSKSDRETVVDERPTKRQRLDSAVPSCRQLFLEEVDLEIALRHRLAATIQSRITWALLLQEYMSRNLNRSDDTTFRDASIDALEAIEAPCDLLFTRSVRPLEHLVPATTPASRTDTPSSSTTVIIPQLITSRTRGHSRTIRTPPKKLLFLRNTSTQPPQIVKLTCPDCARTDFSSLQGLLNHCRLRHHREFGSHDECVQSSAVLVEGDEQQSWVVANGTEVAGISLPGLRRLFEIAVGGGAHAVLPLPLPNAPVRSIDMQVESDINKLPTPDEPSTSLSASLLTRTLGHHEDTPALAPFLGRAPKTRCINVYDTDDHIDIFTSEATIAHSNSWRVRYAGRSQAAAPPPQEEVQLNPSSPGMPHHDVNEDHIPQHSALHGIGSRFHIVARVTIEDHSLWIPPEKRSQSVPEHTHRWRLTISSPSYSVPLNSFLDKLTISCVTDPPPFTLVNPVILEGPPFVITSTTDRPFLASLEFTWAAHDRNVSMMVEHWVELDPLRMSGPVNGDQQVFDVELDRNTELLPTREEQKVVSWEHFSPTEETSLGHTIESAIKDPQIAKTDSDHQKSDSPVHERLRKLLSQVPLTSKDVKGRLTRQMPYHIAATPMHFLNLIYGRRKAVEWGRARALREAYEASCAQDANQREDGPIFTTPTTADVYHWLEAEGHFPRNVTPKISPPQAHNPSVLNDEERMATTSPTRSDLYCHRCGLHALYHPNIEAAESANAAVALKQESGSVSIAEVSGHTSCTTFITEPTRMPVIDVASQLINPLSARLTDDSTYSHSPFPLPPKSLLAVADPSMVVAIRNMMQNWTVPRYIRPNTSFGSPLGGKISASTASLDCKLKSESEEALAPAALLSLLTQSMVKFLLRGGLEVYRRDQQASQRLVLGGGSAGGSRNQVVVERLLTPSHILRWVAQNNLHGTELTRAAVALLIGRLGTVTSI